MSRAGARSLVAAVALTTALPAATARADEGEPQSLWDDVAHPNRRACASLVQEGARFTQAGQPSAASRALRKASGLCPDDREAAQALGESLLGEHDFAGGRRALEHARLLADGGAKADPLRDVWLAFYLGFAREVTGDLEGAIVEHRRVEALGGLPPANRYLVHYNLGDELMAVGRLEEAIDEYRRAVALASDRSMPRLALAVALDRHGELDKSRVELRTVLSLDPQLRRVFGDEYVFVPEADSHYYLALGMLARGQTAEARQQLRSFLAALPEGNYRAQAAERLATAERSVDARELDVSDAAVDSRAVARSLAPLVAELESCLPREQHPTRVKLVVAPGGIHAEPAHPAAACLDPILRGADGLHAKKVGWVTVPLAGRRDSPSPSPTPPAK